MKSTRSSDMAVSFPRVSRAWTSRGLRTHRVRSVVSDEFAVLDHASVHRPVSGTPRPLSGGQGRRSPRVRFRASSDSGVGAPGSASHQAFGQMFSARYGPFWTR